MTLKTLIFYWNQAFCSTGDWKPVAPCPYIQGTPAATFTIDNKIYFVEGQGNDSFAIPQTVMFTP